MNTTNKILIVAFIGQVLFAMFMLGSSERTTLSEPELLVPEFNETLVERIEVFRSRTSAAPGTGAPDLIMGKENGVWVVKSHFDYPVDSTKMEEFLGKMSTMSARGTLAEGLARQEQLSVSDANYQRKVLVYSRNREQPLAVYVGQSAGGRKIAVRIGGRDDIYATSGFSPAIAQYSVLGWIDTTYLRVPQNEIASLQITNAAGEFAFRKGADGAWSTVGDAIAPPSEAAGEGLVWQLNVRQLDTIARTLSLLKFNEPADPRIPRGSPLATVTMEVTPGLHTPSAAAATTMKHTFVIGPERDGRYIVTRNNAPPVWIHINNLDRMVNFSPMTMYRKMRTNMGTLGQPGGLHGQPGGSHGQPGGSHGQPGGSHGQPGGSHGQPGGSHGQPPHGQRPNPHG